MMPASNLGKELLREAQADVTPESWDVVTVGQLIDNNILWVQTGFSCSERNVSGHGLPHIRPMNVNEQGQIQLAGLNYISTNRDVARYLLKPNDIVFNNTNSEELVGKTALWKLNGDYALSNHMTIVRVQNQDAVVPIFLATYLHRLWQIGYARTMCRRYVNQAGIALERLRAFPVTLPPLPEQRRIAAVLNTIQDAIAAQEDVITAAKEFKRSLMHRLFTVGPGREPAPTKETEIGEIPTHWQVIQLGECATVSSGTTPSRADSRYWVDGTVPWVKTGEVDYCHITATEERVTELALRETSLRLYRAGTLILAMYGQGITRGKVAILDIPATINQACAAILGDGTLSTEYMYHYFTSAYERLRSLSHGTQQLNLNAQIIRSVNVPVAPIDEQQQVADFLNSTDAKIAAEEDRLTALQALFKSMLHQLMTGQIRLLSDEGLPLA